MGLLIYVIPILLGAALLPALFGPDEPSEDEFGDGADTFRGDPRPELLNAGEGFDNVDGGGGNDTINGGPGIDLLFGGADDDVVDGGGWNDFLAGGEGDDTLIGDVGRDAILSEAGDDSITGGGWADFLVGGDGADTIEGGVGNDTLTGGRELTSLLDFDLALAARELAEAEAEELTEGEEDSGEDTPLFGYEYTVSAVHDDNVDILDGGDGNDVLELGAGDEGTGGLGKDTFEVFYDPSLGDTPPLSIIRDYTPGTDRIDIAMIEDDDLPVVGVVDDGETGDALISVNSTIVARVVGVAASEIELSGVTTFYEI